MDEQMMRQLLQSYGAPMTNRNANAARQFFAANPELAEKRAMGLRGSGIDDNSDLLDAMLEKVMAQTDAVPQGRVEVGQPQVMPTVQASTGQNRRTATAAPRKTYPNEYSPRPTARSGQDVSTTKAQPQSSSQAEEIQRAMFGDTALPTSTTNPKAEDNWGIPDWLKAVLGITAAGALAPKAPNGVPDQPQITGANPNQKQLTYQPKIEDRTPGGNFESVGQEMDAINNRNTSMEEARRRQLQAEIDADNFAQRDAIEAEQRLQEQVRRQLAIQKATRDTVNAAKRAVGRRP